MRHSLIFIFTFLAILFLPISSANAQNQQYMYTDILQPLNFGAFLYHGTEGPATVLISTSGQTNSSIQPFTIGDCGIISITTNVTNGNIQYIFSNTTATLQGSGGGTLNVTNLTAFNSKEKINDTSGEETLESSIGGTAIISSGLAPGTYTGFAGLTVMRDGFTSLVNVPISLILMPQLGIEEVSPLNFGSMQLVAGMGGRVRVDPATGLRTLISGSVNLANSSPSQGHFRIAGIANSAITISLPSSVTVYNKGGATMTAENFTRHPATPNPVIESSGYLDINVGGDLVVSTNQASGSYSGSYMITVNY